MHKDTSYGLITTLSGMFGGLTEFSINSDFMKMIIAAAVSAFVGYGIRLILDKVFTSLKKVTKK